MNHHASRTPKLRQRFVALDRDGTIIVDHPYLSDPDQVELAPRAGAGLRRMRDLGLGLIVITNQSGIQRGFFTEARLHLIHQRMLELLRNEGVEMDGIYYCPHLPEDGCACRKPKIGLVELAAHELGFDPRHAIVVGDAAIDVECGRNVGAATILVCPDHLSVPVRDELDMADHIVGDLLEAAEVVERLLTASRGG